MQEENVGCKTSTSSEHSSPVRPGPGRTLFHGMADAESALGLQQVEPSPVDEESPSFIKQAGYFDPPPSTNSPQRAPTVGLSQHSPIWYLTRLQKYSTYAASAFFAAHIANTSLIPLITRSVPESERYLLLTRPYYQGLPAEPLLIIIPIWVHVASGLAMRLYRRTINARRYGEAEGKSEKSFFSDDFWPKVSVGSQLGFLLAPLLAGHTFINRVIPNQFPGGSSNINLGYVSHAFAKLPLVSYVGYTALMGVACFHITWGWAKWLGLTPEQVAVTDAERRLVRKRRGYLVNGLAAALTGLWMAGSFGVIARGGAAPGWVGRQYDEMYRRIPLVGQWM